AKAPSAISHSRWLEPFGCSARSRRREATLFVVPRSRRRAGRGERDTSAAVPAAAPRSKCRAAQAASPFAFRYPAKGRDSVPGRRCSRAAASGLCALPRPSCCCPRVEHSFGVTPEKGVRHPTHLNNRFGASAQVGGGPPGAAYASEHLVVVLVSPV